METLLFKQRFFFYQMCESCKFFIWLCNTFRRLMVHLCAVKINSPVKN